MKIEKSSAVSPFGGLNFVIEQMDRLGIGNLLSQHLPRLNQQSQYDWRDILYGFWSVFFCGGDCAEDLAGNLKAALRPHPHLCLPSPDRVLDRMKELSEDAQLYSSKRTVTEHWFAVNDRLNRLNIALCTQLFPLSGRSVTLDYDNTLCLNTKKDASGTYVSKKGYQPGVAFIGKHVVYVENRSGRSTAHVGQHKTLERAFALLEEKEINVANFRADSASYGLETILAVEKNADSFYIRARMSDVVEQAIARVECWKKVSDKRPNVLIGETTYTPFQRAARESKKAIELKQYRLVITKEKRKDGQINCFTKEAFQYAAIVTNDTTKDAKQVVDFYNQRGAIEREFETLKYDFGWKKLPFSFLEQNNVYLLLTSMCRNIYAHMIDFFSRKVKGLMPHYRLKKFIFRFICIPAKWINRARSSYLRLYGDIPFKP